VASQDSVFTVVIKLQATLLTYQFQLTAEAIDLSLFQSIHTRSEAHSASHSIGNRESFSSGKLTEA
jgi:hypothetical protein